MLAVVHSFLSFAVLLRVRSTMFLGVVVCIPFLLARLLFDAGRSVRRSGWDHVVSCLDRQSFGLPTSRKLRHPSPAYNAPDLSCYVFKEGLTDSQKSSGGTRKHKKSGIIIFWNAVPHL
jgi:hypothetical protein